MIEQLLKDVCEKSYKDFFTQKLIVGEYPHHSWDYCKELCAEKRVLHIGCSDYPFSNPEATLHICLSKLTKELHGCDINGIEEMREHYNGVYFSSIFDVKEEYDVILVPNIIEHLENPGVFIEQLFNIPFKKMFVLVPNYDISTQSIYEGNIFLERIHPDHYAWYSPYTLYHLLEKYIAGKKIDLNFFSEKQMIGILIEN